MCYLSLIKEQLKCKINLKIYDPSIILKGSIFDNINIQNIAVNVKLSKITKADFHKSSLLCRSDLFVVFGFMYSTAGWPSQLP